VIELPFVTLNGAAGLSWYDVPSTVSSVVTFLASLLLAGAAYCLGFGIRGENGLVGGSRIGRVAVFVFVTATVVKSLIRLFFDVWSASASRESAIVRGGFQLGIGAVALACVIVAVIVVVHGRRVNRALRWGLVITAAWWTLIQAIQYLPVGIGGPDEAFMGLLIFVIDAHFFGLLLQLALGAGIALHGQSHALRRRLALINEHW